MLELQILELQTFYDQTPEQQVLQVKEKNLAEPFKEGQALPCPHVCLLELLHLSFFSSAYLFLLHIHILKPS